MLLFVYGTLRKGSSQHSLLRQGRFAGTGTIRATLYDLGTGFPAAVEEGTRALTEGELYEIPQDLLDELDEYEGYYPDGSEESLYDRREMRVRTRQGDVPAWVYLMNPEYLEKFFATEIRDGRWKGG